MLRRVCFSARCAAPRSSTPTFFFGPSLPAVATAPLLHSRPRCFWSSSSNSSSSNSDEKKRPASGATAAATAGDAVEADVTKKDDTSSVAQTDQQQQQPQPPEQKKDEDNSSLFGRFASLVDPAKELHGKAEAALTEFKELGMKKEEEERAEQQRTKEEEEERHKKDVLAMLRFCLGCAAVAGFMAIVVIWDYFKGCRLGDELKKECGVYEHNGERLLERLLMQARSTGDVDHWARELGCHYATNDGTAFSTWCHANYWDETALYRLSPALATEIQVATFFCYNAMLELAQEICEDSSGELLGRLGYQPWVHPHFVNSFYQSQQNNSDNNDGPSIEADLLGGRFDFIIDENTGSPVLLELNAQTPTVLVEAAALQRDFKKNILPGKMQLEPCPPGGDTSGTPTTVEQLAANTGMCNWIENSLLAAFRNYFCLGAARDHFKEENGEVFFVFADDEDIEVKNTVSFLQSLAKRSITNPALANPFIGSIDQLLFRPGYNNKMIHKHVFSHYPFEALLGEKGGDRFVEESQREIENFSSGILGSIMGTMDKKLHFHEPLWKMILTSKALLPLLYERHPDCRFLRPACYLSDDVVGNPKMEELKAELQKAMSVGGGLVAKPFLGREGLGVLLSHDHIGSIVADKKGRVRKAFHKMKEKVSEKMGGADISGCINSFFELARKEEAKHLKSLEGTSIGAVVEDRSVVQTYVDSPILHGRHSIIGSWVINGQPSGIGVREDLAFHITKNHSSFCPCVIDPALAPAQEAGGGGNIETCVENMLYSQNTHSEELQLMLQPSPLARGIRQQLYGNNGVEFDDTKLQFGSCPQPLHAHEPEHNERRRRRRGFWPGGWWSSGNSGDSSSSRNRSPSAAGTHKKDDNSGRHFTSGGYSGGWYGGGGNSGDNTSRRRPPPPTKTAERVKSAAARATSTSTSGGAGRFTSRPAPKSTGSYMSWSSGHAHARGGG